MRRRATKIRDQKNDKHELMTPNMEENVTIADEAAIWKKSAGRRTTYATIAVNLAISRINVSPRHDRMHRETSQRNRRRERSPR